MTTKTHARTRTLVEGALMIALSTVLSYFPIYELPHGGSVTFVSMLPIILMSLRHGPKWGLFTAFVHSLIQLFLGLKNLTYCQTLGAQIGCVLLDYVLAFTVLGLGGMFRGKIKNDAVAFTVGSFIAMMLRYLCSFLSGWILWADVVNDAPYMQEVIGTYIPALANVTGTTLAIIYSLVYNGVYMIPEIVLTCVVGFLLVQFAGNQVLKELRAG